MNVGIIRCGNIYGPGDFNTKRIVPETIINALSNKRLIIRSSGNSIKKKLPLMYFFVFKTASPVPFGLILKIN